MSNPRPAPPAAEGGKKGHEDRDEVAGHAEHAKTSSGLSPSEPGEPAAKTPAGAEIAPRSDLQTAADALKAKIALARSRNNMPLDSTLGNPNWEKRAADGHLDIADDDD